MSNGRRLLAMVHQPDAGPGVFAEAAVEAGWAVESWTVSDGGDPDSDPLGYDAVLCLGGAAHPDQDAEHPWMTSEKGLLEAMIEAEVPLLGVCLGAQLVSIAAGGTVRRAAAAEIGWVEVEITEAGAEVAMLAPLAPRFEAFEWHSYECVPPEGSIVLASVGGCPQAFSFGSADAIQFHAEVSAADALDWIDDYRSDEGAVAIGLDAPALRAETEAKIPAFNRLGRDLFARWLARAERSPESG